MSGRKTPFLSPHSDAISGYTPARDVQAHTCLFEQYGHPCFTLCCTPAVQALVCMQFGGRHFLQLHTTLMLLPQVRPAASTPGASTVLAYRSGRSRQRSGRCRWTPFSSRAHSGQPDPAVLWLMEVCHFALHFRHLHHAFLLLNGKQVLGSIVFTSQSYSCIRSGYRFTSELHGQTRELLFSPNDPDMVCLVRACTLHCQRMNSPHARQRWRHQAL